MTPMSGNKILFIYYIHPIILTILNIKVICVPFVGCVGNMNNRIVHIHICDFFIDVSAVRIHAILLRAGDVRKLTLGLLCFFRRIYQFDTEKSRAS